MACDPRFVKHCSHNSGADPEGVVQGGTAGILAYATKGLGGTSGADPGGGAKGALPPPPPPHNKLLPQIVRRGSRGGGPRGPCPPPYKILDPTMHLPHF